MRLLLTFCLLTLVVASAAGKCMFWTPWINADDPYSGDGDYETVGYNNRYEEGKVGRVTKALERKGIICSNPLRAECRQRIGLYGRGPWHASGDKTKFTSRINCDITGLACSKKRQVDGMCADYEVRLLCWKPCAQLEWSRWRDGDNPSGHGDYEVPGMTDHPVRDNLACPSGGSPLEIQCQTTKGVAASLTRNPKIKCDVINGFSCVNRKQPDGKCLDYRVRYLCYKTYLVQHKKSPIKRQLGGGGGGIIPDIAL